VSLPLAVGLILWACGWPIAFMALHAQPTPRGWTRQHNLAVSAFVALFWPPIGFVMLIGMALHMVRAIGRPGKRGHP
jgi:hypothetical protein